MLFDAYIMVDWSANSAPNVGENSIWLAMLERTRNGPSLHTENPSSRHEAVSVLANRIQGLMASGRRVLVGFDFPFGFPAGTAEVLGLPHPHWQSMWCLLDQMIEDNANNTNNRFEVAGELNHRLTGAAAPFWGHHPAHEFPNLGPVQPPAALWNHLQERRITEEQEQAAAAQSIWQLFYAGSVGSQALLGMPRVRQLRYEPEWLDRAAVWPFETGLSVPDTEGHPLVFCEIYPSIIEVNPGPDEILDEIQVRSLAEHFANEDETGRLAELMGGTNADLTDAQRRKIKNEEGWILGIAL